MNTSMRVLISLTALAGMSLSTSVLATRPSRCGDLPNNTELRNVLLEVKNDPVGNGGVPILGVWAALVDTTGAVCAVVSSEEGDLSVNSELAHRIFAIQKANTSNAFSNSRSATASGQLYTQSLPGGTLYGAMLNTAINFNAGNVAKFGTAKDPLIGKRIGG